MDIEQLKERIAADPAAPIDSTGLTVEEKAIVEAFRDEMLSLDRRVAKALAIDVPALNMPTLPDIEASAAVVSLPERSKRFQRAPLWLGLAASVTLVAVLGGRTFFGQTADYSALAAEVVAHLDYEPYALTVTTNAVSEQRLKQVVDTGKAELGGHVGLVTYAQTCIINGKTVPHLVVQGKLGPITLLLMPNEPVDRAVPLSGESINGVILPVGGGSIAIIGDREENLDEIERQVVDSVTWKI